MNSKKYKLPNGKTAVFEYDVCGIGKITLECMDELMDMIADRPQGKWIEPKNEIAIRLNQWVCSNCNYLIDGKHSYCPHCGARMKGADDE